MFDQPEKQRTWGFRLYATDLIIIAVAAVGAVGLYRMEMPLWWMLVIVATHFFLFCNVIRMRRVFEVTWAILFVVNIGAWLWFGEPAWHKVLAGQLPVSLILIVTEIRSPRYHGIQARRLNPDLGGYLEGRIQ